MRIYVWSVRRSQDVVITLRRRLVTMVNKPRKLFLAMKLSRKYINISNVRLQHTKSGILI